MTDQQEVNRRAREYLRTQWFLDEDWAIDAMIDDPMFTDSMAYRCIELSVAMDELKAAIVASLPCWLRKLFLQRAGQRGAPAADCGARVEGCKR